jgi:N-ethylmaleimide reductase
MFTDNTLFYHRLFYHCRLIMRIPATARMSSLNLLQPFTGAGGIIFKNRVGLAPLTRGRADPVTACVKDIHAVYYSERASGGILFTEATGISRQGLGWFCAPGIWSREQVDAWKGVTAAVHKNNGLIFSQLWHMGRAGHSDVFGSQPVSASAIAIPGEVTAANYEKKPYEVPRPLTVDEIHATVQDYANAAKNAIEAGFDGVQLHSANGYLIDQFLQTCSNQRTDAYGGSLENRLRFVKEVIEAVLQVLPKERLWLRFSPNGTANGMGSADNVETFNAVIALAASYGVGGIEVMDGIGFGRPFHGLTEQYSLVMARAAIAAGNPAGTTALAANVGYTLETAEAAVSEGRADFVTFGRPYMSNPDLVERFRDGVPLTPSPERAQWWSNNTADGYITYPRATPTATAAAEK